MSDVLSFYFNGAIVQAVRVHIAGQLVTVKDARTFPFDELDVFLSTCKEKVCIVCSNPQIFHQDIIHLPPAAGKLYDDLVRAEIHKTYPDLTSFSIFHRTVGEATIDTRLYSKIVVFSYPDDFLSDFIQTINRHGMAISHVYPAPCSISRLALSTCSADPGQPRIFIATLPGEKLILVSENNELEFLRKMPSFDNTLLPEDANNINMTIDYCLQTLRVRPIEAVMLNQSELSGEHPPHISVPYRASLPPQLANVPPHIIQEYLAPVAAALHRTESPGIGTILPSDYALFSTHKKLLTASAAVMCLLALLLTGYLVTEWLVISDLKSKVGRARTELSGSASEIAAFKKLDAEVNKLKQPLDFINKHNISLNPAAALAALVLPESRNYLVKGVTIRSGEGALEVQIDGTIEASGYSDTQAVFEETVARIAAIPGYAVSSSTVDIKQKNFTVQARYNGREPQHK